MGLWLAAKTLINLALNIITKTNIKKIKIHINRIKNVNKKAYPKKSPFFNLFNFSHFTCNFGYIRTIFLFDIYISMNFLSIFGKGKS